MQVYNDELYHYGKLGMKWGKRTNKQEVRKEQRQMVKDQFRHPIHSTAAQLNLIRKNPLRAIVPDHKTVKNLNEDVRRRVENDRFKKERKNEIVKKNVKEYKNKWDDAAKAESEAYKQSQITNELYRKTGSNIVSRVINNIKGESEAVKKYSKAMDKATTLQDTADDKWDKVNGLYKKTGSNRVSRVINNIKY